MRKILIVVDMQNDFIEGSLGTKEAVKVVSRVVDKISEYLKDTDEKVVNVLATRDTHFSDYLNTQEGLNLPVEHCIRDTYGWQLHPNVAGALKGRSRIIDKYTFGSTRLVNDLRPLFNMGIIDSIELVGLCTDICVVSNALLLKAAMPEATITVDASCCAGVTPETHKAAITTMKMCQINVINEEEL